MDIAEIQTAVGRALALKRRDPGTVAQALGADFIARHEHLVAMLGEPDLDVERLTRMLGLAHEVQQGTMDQNAASEAVGTELAMDYVDAVRVANGKLARN
jgi:hypothetical protein